MEKMKNGRVKKIIALWVAFALVIVPLTSHVGKRMGTKAAAPEVGTENIDLTGAVLDETGEQTGMESEFAYVVPSGGCPATATEVSFSQSGSLLGFELTAANGTIGESVVSGWKYVVASELLGGNYVSNPSAYGDKVESDNAQVTAAPDKTIYVYGQPIISEKNTGFTLLGIYQFKQINSLTVPNWNVASPAKSAALTSTDAGKKYIGAFKYGYQKDGGSIVWSNLQATVGGSAETEGEYTGYVGYFDRADSQQPILQAQTVSKMTIDNSAPNVSVKVYHDSSDEPLVKASDGNVYVDKGTSNYRYQLKVSDATSSKVSYFTSLDSANEKEIVLDSMDGSNRTHMLNAENTTIEAPIVNADSEAITITLKDELGNEKTYTNVFPRIVAVKRDIHFTVAPALDESVDISSGYTKSKVKLLFTVESGSFIDKVKVDTGSGYEEYTVSSTKDHNTGNYRYRSSITLPNDDITDYLKVQNVKVQVIDAAGNTTPETTVLADYAFDNKAPTYDVTNGIVVVEEKAPGVCEIIKAGSNEEDPSENRMGEADGKYTLVLDKKYKYRLYAKIVDDGVGVEKVRGCYSQNFPSGSSAEDTSDILEFSKETPGPAWDADSDDWYYCDVDKTKLSEDEYRLMYIQAVDKSGNVVTRDCGILMKQPENVFLFENASLKTKNGQLVDILTADVNEETNEPYVLTAVARSSNPITQVYVQDANMVIPTGMNKAFTESDNTQATHGREYSVSFSFEIPAGSSLNKIFDSLKLYAKNSEDASIHTTIGTILYDATKPIVKKQNGEALTSEKAWYTSFDLAVRVTSGAQAVESDIVDAQYEISNTNGQDQTKAFTDLANGVAKATIHVPESATPEGTKITFTGHDNAGNAIESDNVEVVRVDKTNPKVMTIKVNGVQNNTIPVGGIPMISTTVTDNLAIKEIDVTMIDPLGNETYKTFAYAGGEALAVNGSSDVTETFAMSVPTGMNKWMDGEYLIQVKTVDKAGNESPVLQTRFEIDNSAPELTIKAASGTVGGKVPNLNFDGTGCDYFYRSNVGVEITYEDAHIDQNAIVVTDNGKAISVSWKRVEGTNKCIGTYTATSEGKHIIKVDAVDKTGNQAKEKQITFVKDVQAPIISTLINGGMVYTENMGMIDITSNATVNFSVSDANEDVNDFNYRLTKRVPNQPATTSSYIGTTNRNFAFVEEAEYTIDVYAVDMAGNRSGTRTVNFRVDKTAPELSIGGAASGAISSGAATVSFNMKEAFWWDATGTINIYRKAGDASKETLYKTIKLKPTGYASAVSETLTETGEYRMEFDASDRAGHSASLSQKFTIDREAPVITLSGVNNYDMTSSDVDFTARISDDFYTSKKVSVVGTRQDEAGNKNPIVFSGYYVAGNPTIITETFKESGIYDIEITSEDIAGNKDTQKVHFTIDKDKPKIGKLPIEDGAVLTSFDWDVDLEDLVTDLTVCKVHMYLNGSEYDGNKELEDGTYTILITAEDENGNYTDNSGSPVTFVLDTKAPTFIVTGVEDGEAKQEIYNINVSLQLEEDTLESVTLNGKAIDIADNTANLEVATKGDYKLQMTAVDKAGNKAEQTISFTYGEKSHSFNWIIILVCVLLLAGVVVVVKKKNEK